MRRDAVVGQLPPPPSVGQRLRETGGGQERAHLRITQQHQQIIAAERAREMRRRSPPVTAARGERGDQLE
ncbi:MAG TPA: hypothetical protein VHB25_10960 [Gemmatimonadaceae bacterium]|nr:hypothetical protein [Gemmatimonadaceae bacterium]